jgi:transketolase
MTTTLSAARDQVVALAALATGDEKHQASSYSTLDVLLVLYERVLRHDPVRPGWEGRDRFLLSKGHGPAAYFAALAHRGFFPVAWLPGFMTRGGRLGAHPDRLLVPGVEVSTGSLGHGLPMAVGVALALRAKRHAEPRVFVLTGDAELNEGSNWEAILAAPALGLGNLTLIVVDNHSSTVGPAGLETALAALGWDAARVSGRDHDALAARLSRRHARIPGAVIADVERKS